MSSQAHNETALTCHRIVACLWAAEQASIKKAAKAWLAGRKNSPTPVADRLIAKWAAEGCEEAFLRKALRRCVIGFSICNDEWKWGYFTAEEVACTFVIERFSQGKRRPLIDAVSLMQEIGVPETYWKKAAAELAAQAQEPAKPRRRRKPVQQRLPLTEMDEAVTASKRGPRATKPAKRARLPLAA